MLDELIINNEIEEKIKNVEFFLSKKNIILEILPCASTAIKQYRQKKILENSNIKLMNLEKDYKDYITEEQQQQINEFKIIIDYFTNNPQEAIDIIEDYVDKSLHLVHNQNPIIATIQDVKNKERAKKELQDKNLLDFLPINIKIKSEVLSLWQKKLTKDKERVANSKFYLEIFNKNNENNKEELVKLEKEQKELETTKAKLEKKILLYKQTQTEAQKQYSGYINILVEVNNRFNRIIQELKDNKQELKNKKKELESNIKNFGDSLLRFTKNEQENTETIVKIKKELNDNIKKYEDSLLSLEKNKKEDTETIAKKKKELNKLKELLSYSEENKEINEIQATIKEEETKTENLLTGSPKEATNNLQNNNNSYQGKSKTHNSSKDAGRYL